MCILFDPFLKYGLLGKCQFIGIDPVSGFNFRLFWERESGTSPVNWLLILQIPNQFVFFFFPRYFFFFFFPRCFFFFFFPRCFFFFFSPRCFFFFFFPRCLFFFFFPRYFFFFDFLDLGTFDFLDLGTSRVVKCNGYGRKIRVKKLMLG